MSVFGQWFGVWFGNWFGDLEDQPQPEPEPDPVVADTPWGGIYKPSSLVGRYRTFLRHNDRYVSGQILAPIFRNPLRRVMKRRRKP